MLAGFHGFTSECLRGFVSGEILSSYQELMSFGCTSISWDGPDSVMYCSNYQDVFWLQNGADEPTLFRDMWTYRPRERILSTILLQFSRQEHCVPYVCPTTGLFLGGGDKRKQNIVRRPAH